MSDVTVIGATNSNATASGFGLFFSIIGNGIGLNRYQVLIQRKRKQKNLDCGNLSKHHSIALITIPFSSGRGVMGCSFVGDR